MTNTITRRAALTGAVAASTALSPFAAVGQPETQEGTLTALPESLTTLEARLAHFCALTGAEPPAIEYDADGAALLTDGLIDFAKREGANLDWLVCGDVDGMVLEFSRARKESPEIRALYLAYMRGCGERDAYLARYAELERRHGIGAPEAEAFEAQHVNPAHDRLSEIADALAACPARYPRDLAMKAAVSAEIDVSPLAVSLRGDVTRLAK